jgi:hypothetical protein
MTITDAGLAVTAGRCCHQPSCPPASASDRAAARAVSFRPEQGWSLLCNGIVVFDDGGELKPGYPR